MISKFSFFHRHVGLAILSALVCSGCASLQSISMTEIPPHRGHPLKAERTNLAFLGIHFSNSFADDLQDELRDQCPGGKVTGLYTKYESYIYVLFQQRVVTVTGYCVDGADLRAAEAMPQAAPQPTAAPSQPPLQQEPATGLSYPGVDR